MNTQRLIVLGFAALAAGGAAFLARGLLGGGTPTVAAKVADVSTSEVLVASSDLAPGQRLTPDAVHWQKWPSSNVDPSFVKHSATPDLAAALKGTVVRSPLVTGEPLSAAKFVHSESANFMSATLTPGMRAMSIPVTVASVAGGFIQPNDRIDVILTSQISDTPRRFRSVALLKDIRVLAVDQEAKTAADKSQKPVSSVQTATLELTPAQAQKVTRAQATGTLSLSLRSLVDQPVEAADRVASARARFNKKAEDKSDDDDLGAVSVIRYGVVHAADASGKGE